MKHVIITLTALTMSLAVISCGPAADPAAADPTTKTPVDFAALLAENPDALAKLRIFNGTGKLEMEFLANSDHIVSNAMFSGASETKIKSLAPQGYSQLACRAFLVKNSDGKSCLIDTGKGGPFYDEYDFYTGKADEKKVLSETIGAILLTHSHPDHTGGLLAADGESPAFPNATVYITAPELEFWRKSRPDNLAACEKAYKFSIITPDEKTPVFMPGIVAIDAAGHTPGHVAYLLDTPTNPTLVAGDLLHADMQLTDQNICAVFDRDKPAAVATRKLLLTRCGYAKWNLSTSHLQNPYLWIVVNYPGLEPGLVTRWPEEK